MTELESVKEIATNMGIKVGNIKDVDKIKAMIEEKRSPIETEAPEIQLDKRQRYSKVRKEATKLVRVRITPMSPFERQLDNTLVEVGNKAVKIKRVVPFNEVWHVEAMVLKALQGRKFRTKKERVDPQTRRKIYENVFSASYGIEILPALTAEELKELSADQRARHAID